MFNPTVAFHPGEYIEEELEARNWTQAKFARIIWISRPFLNDIIKGRKNITPSLAVMIGAALWTSPDLWIGLQNLYDVTNLQNDTETQKKVSSIKERVEEFSFA